MNAPSIHDTDVLIAGAGPTGLVLALWLTRLGVRVRIVDKTAESAWVIAAVSSSDAATSVALAFASAFAGLELGSRVTARTLWPRSRRPRATAPPCLPVDPVTTTVSSCVMFWFLSPAVIAGPSFDMIFTFLPASQASR